MIAARHTSAALDSTERVNERYAVGTLVSMVVFMGILLLLQALWAWWKRARLQARLVNGQQHHSATPRKAWARVKKHLVYSPLSYYTQVTRLETCLILLVIAANCVLCFSQIPWSMPAEEVRRTIRNRTGTVATVNLIPLVLLSSRYNPLNQMLQIQFHTFNLVHRLLGRIVVVESVVHVAMWLTSKSINVGWAEIAVSMRNSEFIYSGFIAVVSFIALLLHSPSLIRHRFYETFLHIHMLLACLAIGGLWYHLEERSARKYLIAALGFWVIQRTYRLILLFQRNWGRQGTRATVQILSEDALQVTLKTPRTCKVRPGQYIFLYIPRIGWWSSHPFSVAWCQDEDVSTMTKELPATSADLRRSRRSTTLSLVISRRRGFTDRLYRMAECEQNQSTSMFALLEGPYGHPRHLESYETVLLFAGGVGVTAHLHGINHLLQRMMNGSAATQQIILVWTVRQGQHLRWIEPWLEHLESMSRAKEMLRLCVFITGAGEETAPFSYPSLISEVSHCRPGIDTVLKDQAEIQRGSIAVACCGPSGMTKDVQAACVKYQLYREIDFYDEKLSW